MFFKGKVFGILLQIIYPVVFIMGYYFTNLLVCMGQFRTYTIIGVLFGYLLCYITFYKLLDKLHKFIYNKLTLDNGIKYTKLGKFILK